jgi:hypothetical protein
MPTFIVSLQQLEQYQLEIEADTPDAAKAMAVATLQGHPILRGTTRRTDGTSPHAYSAEQIGGKPTLILHSVALRDEEELSNGYVLARGTSDGMHLHDRKDFHGYVRRGQRIRDRFRVDWHDHRAGIWRATERFTTERGAEEFLRRCAMLYEPNRMKAAQ